MREVAQIQSTWRRAVVGGLLTVSPCMLQAQTIELGPSIGYYRPLGQFDAVPIMASNLPATPSQLAGVAWGADARLTVRQRWAVAAAFSTIPSTLPVFVNPGFGGATQTHERVTVTTVEPQYRIAGTRASELSLGVGAAMIQHGGEGYGYFGSPRSWGGVAGLELEHRLTKSLRFDASARGLVYSLSVNSFEHGRQFDALMTVGLRWRWAWRGGETKP